jgi:hypothetical protein
MKDYQKLGWVRFYRSSLESSIWKNPIVWMVWSWILLKANHQENNFPFNGKDLTIKKGQLISGIQQAIREIPCVSAQNFRTAISYLKSTGRITVQSNNKFSIVTIINWDKYQCDNSPINKPLTSHQQATNKPPTTNNNVKNYKNVKKNNNTITKVIVETKKPSKRDPLIDEASTYFLKVLCLPKEDCPYKQSRQYWYLLLRESRTGIDGVKWLIDQAGKDDFYRNNITSSKDLYYKRVKLVARQRIPEKGGVVDARQII